MIRIFVTGGTFDKTYDEIHGQLSFGDTHLAEMLRLGRSHVDVSIRTLMMIDSLEMTDADRDLIVRNCQQCNVSCIVITHGTDTMVETAAALAGGVSGKTIVAHRRDDSVRVRQLRWAVQPGERAITGASTAARYLHRDEWAALRVGQGEEESGDRGVRVYFLIGNAIL
jgi:hypothetical protein